MGEAAGGPVFFGNHRRLRASRQYLRSVSTEQRRRRPVRRARRFSRRAAVRPLVARPALRPRARTSRVSRARRTAAEGTAAQGRTAQGDGRARQPENRRSERHDERSRDRIRRARPPGPQQHHGARSRPHQRGRHRRSGVVRVPGGRAGAPQPAVVLGTCPHAQLGAEPAGPAAEHGVCAHRREAGRRERPSGREPERGHD